MGEDNDYDTEYEEAATRAREIARNMHEEMENIREDERKRTLELINEQSADLDIFGDQVALDFAAADFSDSDLDPVTPEEAAVDSEPTLFVTEEDYDQFEQGLLDRDDLGAFPEDEITTEAQYHSIISDLFTPRSRAVVLDTWLREGEVPVTVSEIADCSDKLTRQTVHSHLDALTDEFGIIVEDGKKGNATAYRLNYRNPIVQCLEMLRHIGRFGRTHMLLEREFLAPGPEGESIDEIESEYMND